MALDLNVIGAVKQGRARKFPSIAGPGGGGKGSGWGGPGGLVGGGMGGGEGWSKPGGMGGSVLNGPLAGQLGQSPGPRAALSPGAWGRVSGAIGSVWEPNRGTVAGGPTPEISSYAGLSDVLGGGKPGSGSRTPISGSWPSSGQSRDGMKWMGLGNGGMGTPTLTPPVTPTAPMTANPATPNGPASKSIVNPADLFTMFQNAILNPQQALSEIDRTTILNALGLSNASAGLQTEALTSDAVAQRERLGLSNERLGIQSGALDRQGPLSQAQQDINRQFIGLQGQNVDATEAQYRENALRAFRGEESRAVQSGGLFTEGHTQTNKDIQFDLNQALGGVDRSRKGIALTSQQSELSFAEQMAQQVDAKKQLDIMSKSLGIDARDLENKLSQALQQVGLGTAMTTNQLLGELGKIELGQFSPMQDFIGQILSIAGMQGYVPSGGGSGFSGAKGSGTVGLSGVGGGLRSGSGTGGDNGVFAGAVGEALSEAARNGKVYKGKNGPKGDNGRLPADRLVSIGGGHKLQPAVATAWNEMKAAAAKDGILLTTTDSYRTYDAQVDVARRKGLYRNGGLAADPGNSNHGWGTAVDVGAGAQRDWLKKNGARFGFNTIKREPWHWEYGGGSHAGHNHG